MLIVETSLQTKPTRRPSFGHAFAYLGATAGLAVILTPLALAIFSKSPTGTLDSPLPKTEQASATNSPDATNPKPNDISEYSKLLTSAQDHLSKAIETSLNTLTKDSKAQIANELNQSLADVTSAINIHPDLIDGYLKRSSIYTAISKIKPEALKLAEADLALAQSLNRGQTISQADLATPIIFDPTSLPNKISIASPDSSPSSNQKLETSNSSNASQNTFVLPANKQETVITDPAVKSTTYIYLIPKVKTNNPIYVTSKSTGSFTVTSSSANTDDIAVDYYLINQ